MKFRNFVAVNFFFAMRLFWSIAAGQVISILLALTGFVSVNLNERSFVFPVLQSTGFYFLLMMFLLTNPFPIGMPVYLYAILALLDVEANFLAVTAYQYTDITSVLLLNSLTIPWVALLSYFALNRRYRKREMLAIFVCLAGLGLVILSDTLRGRWSGSEASSAWIGDLICVGSSLLYALQNVLQEYMLKKLAVQSGSTREYFGMLGLFGFIISNIQWLVLERSDILTAGTALWTSEVIGLFIGFSVIMFSLYLILGWYIGKFDASLFNMGILTSGVYGILLEFAQKKTSPRPASDWMYILAYAMIVTGVVAYSVNDKSVDAPANPHLRESLAANDKDEKLSHINSV